MAERTPRALIWVGDTFAVLAVATAILVATLEGLQPAEPAFIYPRGGSFTKVSVFPDPLKTGTKSLLAKIANIFMVLVSAVVQSRDLWFGWDIFGSVASVHLRELPQDVPQ